MKKNKKFSIKERILSFKFAFEGLAHFFKKEHNSWIHLAAAVAAIFLAFYLEITAQDWLWIVLAIALVLIAEIFNTAIERMVDLATQNDHPLAKQAKDLAAAATLVTAILAIIIALLVYSPYIKGLIES